MKVKQADYETFLDYRAIIIRAIALAWNDSTYQKKLLNDPKAALKEGFGYEFPYAMNVSVQNHSAEWQPNVVGDWVCKKQNVVTLILPPAPELSERNIALAEYNASHLTFLVTK